MIWLIILLVLAVVVGPVLYLLPNAADKRLTELRAAARRQGLTVQITSIPKLDPQDSERVTAGGKRLTPSIPCTAYKLPLGNNLLQVNGIMLMKLPASPTVTVDEVGAGWALAADSDKDFWVRYNAGGQGMQVLARILPMLPDDVLGIALDARFVSCYWRERAAAQSGVVEQITRALACLRDDLIDRFARS